MWLMYGQAFFACNPIPSYRVGTILAEGGGLRVGGLAISYLCSAGEKFVHTCLLDFCINCKTHGKKKKSRN
jgi:hypothetical protein